MINIRNGTTRANSTSAAPRSLLSLKRRRMTCLIVNAFRESGQRENPREPRYDGETDRHRESIGERLATGWYGERRAEELRVTREVGNAKRRETESVREHQTHQRENSAGESREQCRGEHLRWSKPTRRGGEQLDITRAEHSKHVERDPERESQHAGRQRAHHA